MKLSYPQLYAWYHEFGRHDLPWRLTSDPYKIWVSEVMLQQTQVQTVLVRFYPKFITRFPTIMSLAEASLEEVLTYWQGMGYYRRAKYLHETAILAKKGLPTTIDGLMALPGIGRNTAHAIASFAYKIPAPVVEANVKRVVARFLALETPTEKELWDKATQLIDKDHIFEYNQAMMDIGALVCTEQSPRCTICPLTMLCKGKSDPLRFPKKKSLKKVPMKSKTIIIFTKEDRDGQIVYHLTKRCSAFLHGLYQFSDDEASMKLLQVANDVQHLGSLRHAYSHFKLEAEIYQCSHGDPARSGWFTWEEMLRLPVSKVEEKIFRLLKA